MTHMTWEREESVACVSCPECAFTFDAFHVSKGGGYSCPVCSEYSLVARLAAAEKAKRVAEAWESDVMARLEVAEKALREIADAKPLVRMTLEGEPYYPDKAERLSDIARAYFHPDGAA